MKRILFLVILFFGMILFASETYASITLRPGINLGLIGFWPMAEGSGTKAGDMSGNGKNGMLINGPTWVSGKRGRALNFSGGTDYLNIGNVAPGVQTVAFWMKAGNTTQKILDLNGTANVEVISGTMTANNFASPTIYVDGLVATAVDTKWHYVTVTTGTGINASTMNIGKVGSGYFSGIIDEVRIYNRALSVAEIQKLYAVGLAKINSSKLTKINSSQNSRLTSGLVGMWSFNGADIAGTTAYDRSGQNNNGTISGATPTIGKVGQGLSFDGIVGKVDLGSPASLDFSGTNAFTLSAWAYPLAGNGAGVVFSRGTTQGGVAYTIFNLEEYSFSEDRWKAQISDGTTSASLTSNVGSLSINNWQQMTLVWDGANDFFGLYRNGILIKSLVSSINLWNGAGDASVRKTGIGVEARGSRFFWKGSLDEVRVYNRALSASEITQLYNMGK